MKKILLNKKNIPFKNFGFTLSEVLITLGIVGVIAILTVPGTVRNYTNRLYVAQLKKLTAQLSDTAQAYMMDSKTDNFKETMASAETKFKKVKQEDEDGNMVEVETTEYESGVPLFLNRLKTISKDCHNAADNKKCTGYAIKTLTGTTIQNNLGYTYCVQTINNATVCGGYNPNNRCMSLAVDTNGKAAPNTIGRDVFVLDVHEDGSISDWGSSCANEHFGAPPSSCGQKIAATETQPENAGLTGYASGCYSRIVKSGWNMNY